MYTDPSMMAATLGMAQAEAMKSAAGNPNGAMMGFMGMNMASGMNGGANLQGLYNQGAEKRQQEEQARQMAAQEQSAQQQTGSWTCSCGTSFKVPQEILYKLRQTICLRITIG